VKGGDRRGYPASGCRPYAANPDSTVPEVCENLRSGHSRFRGSGPPVPFRWSPPYTRRMKSRCRVCRLPNPLRATVEEGLGTRTLSFRRASKMTGVGLSALHRHVTKHWSPPIEEPVQPVPVAAPPPSPQPGRPYSSPCVIQLVDQMAIAQLHSKPWPKVPNLSNAWSNVFKPPVR
jgi:hypothetical protein